MTQTEKKKIIERLVIVPSSQKRQFWGREIHSLNHLLKAYPEPSFWKGIAFPHKMDSIIVFRSGYYSSVLEKKYKLFKYAIPPKPQVVLGDKSGSDYIPSGSPSTLKEFLS